ncbi:hypothetical protein V8F20_006640 [Naviculisporaceae sp. PSN 640]
MLFDSMVTSAGGAWVLLSALAIQVHIPSVSAAETITPTFRPHRPGFVPRPTPVPGPSVVTRAADDAELGDVQELLDTILNAGDLTFGDEKYSHPQSVEDRDPGIIRVDPVDNDYGYPRHVSLDIVQKENPVPRPVIKKLGPSWPVNWLVPRADDTDGDDELYDESYLADPDRDSLFDLPEFEGDDNEDDDDDFDEETIAIQPRDIANPEEDLDFPEPNSADTTAADEINLFKRVPVATCRRSKGRLHTQRRWTVTYTGDKKFNGKYKVNCGKKFKKHLKRKLRCKPVTDFTCAASGEEGEDQVTVWFHTPRTCTDNLVTEALRKGTKGKVKINCTHAKDA